MLRGANQFGLFALVDTRGGTAKILTAALAYFNKNQRVLILQNKINFPAAAAIVARNKRQAVLLQVVQRNIFRLRANRYFAVDGMPLATSRGLVCNFSAALAAFSAASVALVSPMPCWKNAGFGSRKNCWLCN